jgi:peptide/nickel transport system substrate-binding protein
VARAGALAAAFAAALLAVPGAGAAPDADAPRRGGTVALAGAVLEPACLNAFFKRCRDGNLPAMMMGLVLPGAFRAGPGPTLRPNLVSHVDYTRAPPFTLTYHIRREARWSDGTPVSSRDFVFTHETSRSAGDEVHPAYAEALEQVVSVRALDVRTLRVVLRSRYADWRRLFPYVLPAHALAGADFSTVWNERIHDPRTGRPIGSGPFLVRGWQRGRELTFERNPRYWGARLAHLDRLVFRFLKDPEEAIEWLRQNELDVVHGLPLSDSLVRELRQLSGVEVQSSPGPSWEHLALRVQPPGHPALGNKLVRRAIAHAIDKTALVRAVIGERDRRDAVSDSAFFDTTSRYYRPNWSVLRYRPAQSRRLLRLAGCRLGTDEIYTCAGERLSLRAFTLAGIPFREESLRIVQKQLRDVGVELVLSFVASLPLFNSVLPNGNFDLAHFSWIDDLAETRRNSLFRCGGSQNWTGYCQRLVDRDLDEAGRVLDAEQYIRVLHRLDARVALDVPLIPLYHRPLFGAARSTVRGYAPGGTLDPFVGAENWWLAR